MKTKKISIALIAIVVVTMLIMIGDCLNSPWTWTIGMVCLFGGIGSILHFINPITPKPTSLLIWTFAVVPLLGCLILFSGALLSLRTAQAQTNIALTLPEVAFMACSGVLISFLVWFLIKYTQEAWYSYHKRKNTFEG